MTPFPLPALALLLAVAQPSPPAEPPPAELRLDFVTPVTPLEACGEEPAPGRAAALARVAIADEVDLTGHIERVEAAAPPGRPAIVVLGRRIDTELAELAGGDRSSLQPGALVRVTGQGAGDGSVRAARLQVLPERDPQLVTRLDREVVKFKEKFWKKAKRHDDPELSRYLSGIASRLLPAYVPASERKLEVQVVLNPELNAFALPDGTIVLHSGIIARMDNEAQLAAVLGHELAHVSQRHALRAMGKEAEHTLLGWGSLLAALALGMSGKGDAAQGVQLMSSAWLSAYSREHEDEADQVGLRYLYLAGYDVREAPLVWNNFQLLYGDASEAENFFYGSHSTGRSREHNLSHEVWKSYEPSGLLGGRVGRDDFLQATSGLLRENARLDLERGNLAWAEWGLSKSLSIDPADARSHVTMGQLALRRGGRAGLEQAVDAFRHAIDLDPKLAPAYRELGYALERLGDRSGARTALTRYLELEPESAEAGGVRRLLARL